MTNPEEKYKVTDNKVRKRASQISNIKLWDPDTKEFLQRTASSWGWILLFYLVYFMGVAAFMAVCMAVHLEMLSDVQPKLTIGNGQAMLTSPGMSCYPRGDIVKQRSWKGQWDISKQSDQFSSVEFSPNDAASYEKYVKEIDDYLKTSQYPVSAEDRHLSDCDEVALDSPCSYSRALWGPCDGKNDTNYGYGQGKPCFLLKMNKIVKWQPDLYASNPSKEELGERWEADHVAVSCQQHYEEGGDTSKQTLGTVSYYPEAGFQGSCFPYCGLKAVDPYVTPVVMVQFDNVTVGEDVQAWCSVWANNIIVHKQTLLGGIVFKIHIEENA